MVTTASPRSPAATTTLLTIEALVGDPLDQVSVLSARLISATGDTTPFRGDDVIRENPRRADRRTPGKSRPGFRCYSIFFGEAFQASGADLRGDVGQGGAVVEGDDALDRLTANQNPV